MHTIITKLKRHVRLATVSVDRHPTWTITYRKSNLFGHRNVIIDIGTILNREMNKNQLPNNNALLHDDDDDAVVYLTASFFFFRIAKVTTYGCGRA